MSIDLIDRDPSGAIRSGDAGAPEFFEPWGSDVFGRLRRPAGVHHLRSSVIPEVRALARRLESQGHRTALQDLLDLPEPSLRVLVWPRPGLMTRAGAPLRATLEFTMDQEGESVSVRWWTGAGAGGSSVIRLPSADLYADGLEGELFDFLQWALDQS